MKCAHCHQAIVHQNSDDEYLLLEALPRTFQIEFSTITDVALQTELEMPLSFCGMAHLCKWAENQISPFTGKPYAQSP